MFPRILEILLEWSCLFKFVGFPLVTKPLHRPKAHFTGYRLWNLGFTRRATGSYFLYIEGLRIHFLFHKHSLEQEPNLSQILSNTLVFRRAFRRKSGDLQRFSRFRPIFKCFPSFRTIFIFSSSVSGFQAFIRRISMADCSSSQQSQLSQPPVARSRASRGKKSLVHASVTSLGDLLSDFGQAFPNLLHLDAYIHPSKYKQKDVDIMTKLFGI